jgi:hypothetical protein
VKVELKLTPLNMILDRELCPDGKPAAGVEVAESPDIGALVPLVALSRLLLPR